MAAAMGMPMNTAKLRPSDAKHVGHKDWVTSIAVCSDLVSTAAGNPRDLLLTASRDKSILIWELYNGCSEVSKPIASLRGHNGFINEIAVSPCNKFVASASDDKTVRVWDIAERKTVSILAGHTHDVLSVAFISDTKLVTGSRDRSIKIWNINGTVEHTFERAHENWVSGVKAYNNDNVPVVVSVGWDKRLRVWGVSSRQCLQAHVGDDGYVSSVVMSPDGCICASAGKMGLVHLWDLGDGNHCLNFSAGDRVNALAFSPQRFWLCAATQKGVKVWDITQGEEVLDTLTIEVPNPQHSDRTFTPEPLSLAWSPNGSTLFVGYSDNTVRTWHTV